jgi:hypothetical protein
MKQLSRNEITLRLGSEPETWTFLGQCYDAGENSGQVCALTQEVAHIFFTLKPLGGGKGRVAVSAESIEQFERWNADLYVKLKTGMMWLQLRLKQVETDKTLAADKARIREAEKKLRTVQADARYLVNEYRKNIRKGALPKYLADMKDLLQKPGCYFKTDEAKALWMEQKTVEMETLIAKYRPMPIPERTPLFTAEELEPVPDPIPVALDMSLTPVMDLGF